MLHPSLQGRIHGVSWQDLPLAAPGLIEMLQDFVWTVMADDRVHRLDTSERIAAFFDERNRTLENLRFEKVVFHHAPDATFMTYRMTGTDKRTARPFAREGVERYTFRNGKLAGKDVYSRPAEP